MTEDVHFQKLSEKEESRQPSDIALRLADAVKSAGGYNAVVARSGVSGNSLTRYLKGQEMKVGTALQLAEACFVSPQWLLFGHALPVPAGSEVGLRPSTLGEIGFLDYYGVDAVRGFGQATSPPERMIASATLIKTVFGVSSGHGLVVRVPDDSMAPTLSPGEQVVVNTSPMPALIGLAALTINGSLQIKRVMTLASGNVLLASDNERYPNEEVPLSIFRQSGDAEAGQIGVIGRVTMRLQTLS